MASMANLIKTNISSIDRLLGGGVPAGSQIILAGGPGSGKTLIAFEYLYRGAKNGEIGIFFSFNEDTALLLRGIKDSLSELTDIDQLIADKKIVIFGYEETKTFMQKGSESTNYAFTGMISQLQSRIDDYHATRVVIDSLSYIRLYSKDPFEYRNLSTSLLVILGRQHVTSIITTELHSHSFEPQQEFYIYDGLILLERDSQDERSSKPTFQIVKLRGASHPHGPIPYQLTSSGLKINVSEG